ncbi:MAG: O-methyltransferase [Candidatus Thorarchaeota archaeon]|jgi:predicted O-methyltransferase YrrM
MHELDLEKATKYITEIYQDKDKPSAKEYIEKAGMEGPIIEDEIARLFKLLLRIARPRKILEIGMNIGFSTTSMALAVKEFGGRVTTLEMDPEIAEVAKKSFVREGVIQNIEIIIGDAYDILPRIESESYDVVFQDSTKRGYPLMLNDCLRILKKGGLLLVDDTLWPVTRPQKEWNESFEGIDKFNRILAESKVESTILPLGEGCTVAVKI